MEHVVFFPAPDGTPAFRRVAALEDAVRLVEHLRNVEGVAEVSVHPLGAEVPLAFRTWYRVEVPAGQEPAPAAPAAHAVPAQAVAPAATLVEPVDVPAVEVPSVEVPEAPVAEAAPVEPVVEPVAEQHEEPAAEPVAVPVLEEAGAGASGNGHRDVASLGFFAT